MTESQTVLDFWFGAPTDGHFRPRDEWFRKDPAFDATMRERFAGLHARAVRGECADWTQAADTALALVIVLDQFPRNMFRDTPGAFASDAIALSTAQAAIARGFDAQLAPVQRWFFYLPFEHAEDIVMQDEAVRLFETLRGDADSTSPIDYAYRHRAVIQRFGRFPHRNAILGRESTAEEAEFLRQPGSSF